MTNITNAVRNGISVPRLLCRSRLLTHLPALQLHSQDNSRAQILGWWHWKEEAFKTGTLLVKYYILIMCVHSDIGVGYIITRYFRTSLEVLCKDGNTVKYWSKRNRLLQYRITHKQSLASGNLSFISWTLLLKPPPYKTFWYKMSFFRMAIYCFCVQFIRNLTSVT